MTKGHSPCWDQKKTGFGGQMPKADASSGDRTRCRMSLCSRTRMRETSCSSPENSRNLMGNSGVAVSSSGAPRRGHHQGHVGLDVLRSSWLHGSCLPSASGLSQGWTLTFVAVRFLEVFDLLSQYLEKQVQSTAHPVLAQSGLPPINAVLSAPSLPSSKPCSSLLVL